MSELDINFSEITPLLLRRAEKIQDAKDLPISANMTVVTTQGMQPEMRDQTSDPTAPRND